ncbi:MAG TPA: serine hydrolase [Magnetospirillum sp.]|nr:serine hydrolase [Magnetospirillum sp.]
MTAEASFPEFRDEPFNGLGAELGNDDWGGDWIGHTGLEDGFEAEIRHYPSRKTAIVFMTNGNSETDASIVDTVAKAVFRGE